MLEGLVNDLMVEGSNLTNIFVSGYVSQVTPSMHKFVYPVFIINIGWAGETII
jgi:hypothetical protein